MDRSRRITVDEFFAPLGDIAFGAVGIGFLLGVSALLLVAIALWALVEACQWLREQKFLGPISFGALVAVVVIHLAGCSSAPAPGPMPEPVPAPTPAISRGSQDPDVWRPTAPAVYPLPR